MKHHIRTIMLSAALLLGGSAAALAQAPAQGAPPAPPLMISSSAYADGAIIPDKYTAAAGAMAVSMPLSWQNVPAGTQSFTLILHDLDTALRKGTGDVLHWFVFNIPGTATSLPEGVPNVAQLPDGTIQGKNVAGKPGFAGPGFRGPNYYHHYVIEFYALDTKLNLTPDASRADVLAAMDGHVLGKAAYEGRFHR